MARLSHGYLETEIIGDYAVATAYKITRIPAIPTMCTMEYNPVFATVERRLSKLLSKESAGHRCNNLEEMGNDFVTDLVEEETINPTVIEQATIEATNGGINPDYVGYRVKGRVYLGANPASQEDLKQL